MKIGFIGASGHFEECLKKRYDSIEYIGYSSSMVGENLLPLENAFNNLGIRPTKYKDVSELLNSGIDTVVVDGIYNTHSECIIAALKKDINVIAEKPLATTLEDYQKLYDATKNSKGKIFSLLTMRFEDSFYTVKSVIDSGIIGEIRIINAQKSYKLGERPEFYKSRETFGGMIPWVAIHMIDLILWYTGRKVKKISAMQSKLYNNNNQDLEITSTVMMMLENEIIATINADYLRPQAMSSHGDDRIRIAGTTGIIEVIKDEVLLNGRRVPKIISRPLFEAFMDNQECDGLYSTKVALMAQFSADNQKE